MFIPFLLWIMLVWKYPWDIPHPDDARFRMIFTEGKKGIRNYLKQERYEHRDYLKPRFEMGKEQVDFLARIFCHEKHRLTIRQAKKHPLFNDDTPFDPIISPKRRSQDPSLEIEERIHRSRYDTRPWEVDGVWWRLGKKTRRKLILFLLEKDLHYKNKTNYVTILDERIVEK